MAEPTFWSSAWTWIKKAARSLLAFLPAILIVMIAIVLVVLGVKNVQIGGLLGKLFGHKEPGGKAIDVANTIPEHRVDSNGAVIPIGTPDSSGQTQAKVVPIEPPSIFSNPNTVTITPPDAAPVVIALPDGVKAKDVDKVVIIKPEVFTVTVKDSSPVTGQHIDDLIKKYGG